MAANRRKILVPLATLTVAGAVAVGSGASFTSTTASTTSVSSGIVSHSNDVTSLDITNIKDGDTITGSVTVTNTGTLQSDLTLQATAADGGFVNPDLNLQLVSGGTTLYNGPFQDVETAGVLDVATLAVDGAGESATVQFIVTLDELTDNSNENKTASASFTWVSTQLEGEGLGFTSAFAGAFGIGS
ncbi:hypothetical protein GCM10027270_34110 [Nocardioides ginkgobilobae]